MLDNCCAFTGHRPHKLPWRYNEADGRCLRRYFTHIMSELDVLIPERYGQNSTYRV